VPRLLPLGGETTRAGLPGPMMLNEATRPGRAAGRGPVGADGAAGPPGPAEAAGLIGAKAARLARAAAAGLAVLPGSVVPVAQARPALAAGAAAVRQGRPAAARRAVLGHQLDDALAAELRDAVAGLGGRVIARSSSPLEADPRWSGAFSSVAGVGGPGRRGHARAESGCDRRPAGAARRGASCRAWVPAGRCPGRGATRSRGRARRTGHRPVFQPAGE